MSAGRTSRRRNASPNDGIPPPTRPRRLPPWPVVERQHLLAVFLADQRTQIVVALLNGSPRRRFDAVAFNRSTMAGSARSTPTPLLGARQTSPQWRTLIASCLDGLVEVAVVEHDRGILAPEFERYRARMARGGGHDGAAGRGLAGECDSIDLRMLGQIFTSAAGQSRGRH